MDYLHCYILFPTKCAIQFLFLVLTAHHFPLQFILMIFFLYIKICLAEILMIPAILIGILVELEFVFIILT